MEYQQKYPQLSEYENWALYHKTVIVLDGGTSSDQVENIQILKELKTLYAEFKEPDLNDSVSAIALIVDELTYDDKKYPVDLKSNNIFCFEDIKDKVLKNINVNTIQDEKIKQQVGIDRLKLRVLSPGIFPRIHTLKLCSTWPSK